MTLGMVLTWTFTTITIIIPGGAKRGASDIVLVKQGDPLQLVLETDEVPWPKSDFFLKQKPIWTLKPQVPWLFSVFFWEDRVWVSSSLRLGVRLVDWKCVNKKSGVSSPNNKNHRNGMSIYI